MQDPSMQAWIVAHLIELIALALLATIAYSANAIAQRLRCLPFEFQRAMTKLEVIEFHLQSIDARAERINPERDWPPGYRDPDD
jgi:hypothetical protein